MVFEILLEVDLVDITGNWKKAFID